MTKTNELLNKLQADATVFYQKLRAYHWTVTGDRFFQLHQLFEDAYTRWADHIDSIAERTVMNGGTPLLSLADVTKAATVQEDTAVRHPRDMVENVAADLRHLLELLSSGIAAAEAEGQRGTANLLDGIRDGEEKALWMLSACMTRPE